jgi:protease I
MRVQAAGTTIAPSSVARGACRVSYPQQEALMGEQLKGKRVAALVTDGFEQVELLKPKDALEQEGARVDVVAPTAGEVRGWNHTDWGERVKVDRTLTDASPDDYDALLLPGGVMNPDRLRTNPAAVQFVAQFASSGKPIAVICHGPWTLVEAGVVRGVRMTSWPSVKTDLVNAGAIWVDEEVVVDRGIVSSRKPDDIPAFTRKMIEEFAEGTHQQRRAS